MIPRFCRNGYWKQRKRAVPAAAGVISKPADSAFLWGGGSLEEGLSSKGSGKRAV